jgi:hypothetical protein
VQSHRTFRARDAAHFEHDEIADSTGSCRSCLPGTRVIMDVANLVDNWRKSQSLNSEPTHSHQVIHPCHRITRLGLRRGVFISTHNRLWRALMQRGAKTRLTCREPRQHARRMPGGHRRPVAMLPRPCRSCNEARCRDGCSGSRRLLSDGFGPGDLFEASGDLAPASIRHHAGPFDLRWGEAEAGQVEPDQVTSLAKVATCGPISRPH